MKLELSQQFFEKLLDFCNFVNAPKKESKKGRNNKGKTAKKQSKRREERKGNKHILLYIHKGTVQTVGIQSWKTGSLNNCTG